MSFLEGLRQNLIVVKPTTDEEAREKVKVIVENESEFPSKFRPAIRYALLAYTTNPNPRGFLLSLYSSLVRFFSCSSLIGDAGIPTDSPESLNDRVDTAEEVEVLLRCFPEILTNKIDIVKVESRYMDGSFLVSTQFFPNPMSSLMIQENAVSFVPLFAELGIEIGQFKERDRGGLNCAGFNVFYPLLTSRVPILVQMREKGLVEKEDTCDLMMSLLSEQYGNEAFDFIEERLLLLVEWNPTIFMDCGKYTYLLHSYQFQIAYSKQIGEIHRLIIKLGMTNCPKTLLGFVFHKEKDRKAAQTLQNRTYFEASCKGHTEWIKQIVHDEVLQSIEKNELRDFIFAAATNDDISLDGLYTLIRYDPIALFRN